MKSRARTEFHVWLERGGVFAFCGVRGGGDKGRAWHEAGRAGNKPKAADDLGYASNTSAVYRGDPFFANAMLMADTVRATASRLSR